MIGPVSYRVMKRISMMAVQKQNMPQDSGELDSIDIVIKYGRSNSRIFWVAFTGDQPGLFIFWDAGWGKKTRECCRQRVLPQVVDFIL